MNIYGVVGYPVSHSKSPVLHNAVFAATGWPGAYTAWACSPERLADFVRAVRLLPLHGVSVTLPHKEAICALVDKLTPRALAVGAVNTLYFEGDTLCGDNTDIAGFLAPLAGIHSDFALVLGTGGVARAAIVGLQERGVARIVVTGRNADKSRALALAFGIETVDWDCRADTGADLIVNATSCGMQGHSEDATPYPIQGWTQGRAQKKGLAYDLVYTPRPTRFLREAGAAGLRVQDGLAMFIGQALEQQRLWTGQCMKECDISHCFTL